MTKVTMIVRDEAGKELERYIAPDRSWIQTEAFGAQVIPSITKPEIHPVQGGRGFLEFVPETPPVIPEEIAKVIDGRDKRWGRNGYEWMGSNRERQGGRTLNRARELFAWAGSGISKLDFPVPLTFESCMSVMQDEKYCKALKV